MKKILSAIQKNFKLQLLIINILIWNLLPISINGQELLFSKNTIDYRQIFQESYEEALKFLDENSWISDSIKKKGLNPDFVISIIFPELIRYSKLRDKMEMGGLFTLYVQYGEKYADFSVGRFQMKPTFIEKLERDIIGKQVIGFNSFNLTNTSQARIERVNRLNDMKWQVNYLVLFITNMQTKYGHIKWNCEDERLKFYAAAYNSGYFLGEEKIRNHIDSKMFYTGIIKSDTCYCYSSIALGYYNALKYK